MRALMLSLAVAVPALLAGCNNANPTKQLRGDRPVYPIGSAAVNAERLINADREPGSWLATGLNYHEQRFSRLEQINDANVSNWASPGTPTSIRSAARNRPRSSSMA